MTSHPKDDLQYALVQATYTICIVHLFIPAKFEGRQNRSVKYAYLISTVVYSYYISVYIVLPEAFVVIYL